MRVTRQAAILEKGYSTVSNVGDYNKDYLQLEAVGCCGVELWVHFKKKDDLGIQGLSPSRPKILHSTTLRVHLPTYNTYAGTTLRPKYTLFGHKDP